MAKISVIVPVFNIENYIEHCILSICNQTFSDLEIILVDDGSTDRSGTICDTYKERDNRIKVIHKEQEGLVSARKTGLLESTCDYVTYVDGDDWIEPNAYKSMYEDMCNYDVDVVFYGHYENIGECQKRVLHNISKGFHDKKSLNENVYPQMISSEKFFSWRLFPALWDALFKREILFEVQMEVSEDIVVGEDAACIYPLVLRANSIYVSDKCFYHYRQSAVSMIKAVKRKEIERRECQILFSDVNAKFEKLRGIYDLRKQWLCYMLFVMIPRSDHLLDGFDELPFLFPFPNISKGMRLAIYGAGTYGRRLYKYLENSIDYDVVAWFDKNYIEFQKEGLCVQSPNQMGNYDFDAIVIANMFADARMQIFEVIRKECPEVTVGMIDEQFVTSVESLKAFRLI